AATWLVIFTGSLAKTDVTQLFADGTLLTGTTPTVAVTSANGSGRPITTPQQGAGAASESQVVTYTASTAGTFTLTFNGMTTSAISTGATAAQVQAALEALPNIGAGNVAVTSTLGPNTVNFYIVFQGAMGGLNQPALVFTNINAVFSAGPTVTHNDDGGQGG